MILSIVEGFDKVGKSKIISDLKNERGVEGVYDKTFIYKPPYAGLDLKFNRNEAWILGYSVIDFIVQSGTINQNYHLIMDRHIASSWVYDRLYGEGKNVDNAVVLEDLRLLNYFDRVSIYYITHYGVTSAKSIYKNTRESHTDKLDVFTDFADYWSKYQKSEELFTTFFNKFDLCDNVVELKSLSDDNGFIVNYV